MNKKMNVLVLAAHPDDETLGAGATISRLAREEHNIKLITFTDGVDARDEKGQRNRNEKLGRIADILGINDFAHADFPDNKMDIIPLLDICKFIEDKVDEEPDLILTHHPDCLNIDHVIVYRATLTVFRPQFGNSHEIWSYMVPSSTDYNPLANFNGNIFLKVSWKDMQNKINALRVYNEEMRDYPHTRSYSNITNIARVCGSNVGTEFAECFQQIRRVL